MAGDGTTTYAVLTQAIANDMKNVTAGASPAGIRRGIDKVLRQLKLCSLSKAIA